MSNPTKARVIYAFPTAHRFRAPFHEHLRRLLKEKHITYEYICASNRENESKFDTVLMPWFIDIPQRVLSLRGKSVVWHPIFREFLKSDLTILQQENRLLANYVLQIAAPLMGKKVAFFGHGKNFQAQSKDSLAERWKRFWARRVYWWFTYTDGCAKLIESYGFDRSRITVFNNSIDLSAIKAEKAALDPARTEALRAELVQGSRNVGVYVGGIYSEKRIPFLLEAARHTRELCPDFHLIVIGAGKEAHLIEEAARTDGWIHYMGPRFGMDKTELVSLAKVWLMPGLVGLAVLDSFVYETPIITTDISFHSPEIDYVQDGVNGMIVHDYNDHLAYAKAVQLILTDDDKRQRLIEGARESVNLYSVENMAKLFADGVEMAIGR